MSVIGPNVDPESGAPAPSAGPALTAGSESVIGDSSPTAGTGYEPTPWELALSAERAGNLVGAALAFLACPPDPARGRAPAVFQAAWCLERAGRTEDAAKYYAEVVESSKEPGLLAEAYFRLAWLALEGRELEAAISRLDSTIALAEAHGLTSPTIEHARYWSVVCLEREGRLLDAAMRYQTIIDGGNPDLWLEAAYRRLLCLSQVGDLDGALAAAEILLQPAANARDPDRLRVLQALAREEQWQIERARAFA